MKTDIIVCHPRDLYYPLWVKRMNENRHLFNRIIVVITQKSSDRDFSNYLKDAINNVTVIEEYLDDGTDWRNAAIHESLKYVDSDRILFLEQDFLMGKGFLEKLLSYTHNTIGFEDGNRLHPACMLIKLEALNKTDKDFSVDPDISDHFGKLTTQLKSLGDWKLLKDLDLPDSFHMSGLSQNYRLTENLHSPVDFYTYNALSRTITQHIEWKKFVDKFINPKPLSDIEKYFYE